MTSIAPVPALSVVIPTLGRPLLAQTLRSLIASDGFDRLEVLVVGHIDDASVARALTEWMKAYSSIRHLPLQFDGGDSSRKKNAGWQEACAPYVAFLDDDVRVAPDWPCRILDVFADEGAGVISGPALVPDDARPFARWAGLTLSSPATGYVAWRYRHRADSPVRVKWSDIIGCNMAFRRSILEEIGGFDPTFWPGEEMLAAYRAQMAGHGLYFHSAGYVYHYPRTTMSTFAKQIFGYGATRIRLLRAGVKREWSPLVPALGVALLLVGLPVSLWSTPVAVVLLLLVAGYLGLVLAAALWVVAQSRRWSDGVIFFLIPVVHFCYGVAEWWEFFRPDRDLSMKSLD